MAKASETFSYVQEGKRAFVETVSDTRTYTFGDSLKMGFAVLLAVIVCVVMIGAINRQNTGGNWYFSVKTWIENISNVFDRFPVPETAIDYIAWTLQVFGWFIGVWAILLDGGWVQGDFDGSVGATPVIRPEYQVGVIP